MARFNIAITVGIQGPGAKQVAAALDDIGHRAKRTADIIDLSAKAVAGFFSARALVGGFRAIYQAAAEGERAMAQLRAGILSTGGAAGYSADGLAAMAAEMQRLSGIDDEVIMGAQGILLTFTRIGREAFPQATQAALDLSARLGQDLSSAALMVGKALNDPIRGMTAMGRAGVQFSEAQKATIKSLVETGRIAEAQAIIFKELETQVGGSAAAFRSTLPGAVSALANTWDDLLESMGEGLGDALGPSIEELIAMLEDLQTSFPREELASIIRDLAEGFVAGARTAAEAAALLAENIDLIKAAVVGYLALRAPLAAVALAESLIAAAKAATLAKTSILGMNAALLASPIGVIAGLAAAAAFAITRYSSAVEAAYDLEMRWVGQQAEREQWLRTLTGRTDELTEAERLLWSERVRGMRVELAQLETEARLAEQRAKEARRLHDALTPKGAGWLGGVVGGMSGAPSAGRVRELGEAAADAKGRHDELARSFEELQRALVLLGMGIGKTRKGMGGLSGDAKKLAEELADLIAELARSAAQNRELADAYGLGVGEEQIDSIKRAHTLHEAYLKDVAKFGKAAADALKPLRAADLDAAAAAAKAKDAWSDAAKSAADSWKLFDDYMQENNRLAAEAAEEAAKRASESWEAFARMLADNNALLQQRTEEWQQLQQEAAGFGLGAAGSALADARAWQADFEKRVRENVEDAEEGNRLILASRKELARREAEIIADVVLGAVDDLGRVVSLFDQELGAAVGNAIGALSNFRQVSEAGWDEAAGKYESAAAAFSSGAAWLAAMVAFVEIFKSINAGKLAGGVTIGTTGAVAGTELAWAATEKERGKLLAQAREIGRDVSKALNDIIRGLGAGLQELAEFDIHTVGDRFMVQFRNLDIRQWFSSFEEAVGFALREALEHSKFYALDESIVTALRNSVAATPEQLQEDLAFAFDYSRLGVDETALALRDLAAEAVTAAEKAYALGLSVSTVADQFVRDAQSLRDDILGISKDPETRQRERAEAFNREIERQNALLTNRIALAEIEILQLEEAIRLRLEEARLTGAITEAERQALLADMARLDFLRDEIEIWRQLLSDLPAPITPDELRRNRPRGGGAGDERARDFETLADMLRQAALASMGDYARGLAEINQKWDEAEELAHGNAEKLAEVNRARAEEIRLLGERAKRELIDPYLGGGSAAQAEFDEVRRQYEDLRANYKALGLALWQVNQAEANRLRLLGLEAAASLGDPIAAAILQFKGLADTLRFLRENLEALGMSAEDFDRVVSGLQLRTFLDIADSMARYIDDEAVRAELAEMRYDMEKAAMLTQIELAKAFGAITEEQYRRLLEIWGMMPADLPAAGAGANDRLRADPDWLARQTQETATELERLKEAFADAKDGIRQFLLDISTNQFGGINPQEALRAAQEEWTRVLAMAQAGQLEGFQGIPEAGRGLIDALKAYSPALYATELPKIQDILRTLGAANTVQDDGLVYTERFARQQEVTNQTLDRGFTDLSSHAARSNATQAELLDEFRQLRQEQAAMNSKLERITSQGTAQKVVGGRG